MKVSGQVQAVGALSRKNLGTNCMRVSMNPRTVLKVLESRRMQYVCRELNHDSSDVQLTASHYSNYAVPDAEFIVPC
jgi:hypothetical protein